MNHINVPFKDQILSFRFNDDDIIEKTRDGVKTFQLKVKFKSSINMLIKNFNADMGVLKMEKITSSDDNYLLYFPINEKSKIPVLLSKYDNTGLVEYIEPNILLEVNNGQNLIHRIEENGLENELLDASDIYNDKYYNLQWHFKNTGQFNGVKGQDVKLEKAWNYLKAKGVRLQKGIKIAVLDDGVDPNHKDLEKTNTLTVLTL